MDQKATDVVVPAAEAEPAKDRLWYKDAIIYQLHIKAFFDSNDDGMGDFQGLSDKLDYVKDLGVNTIWLLPFYPSPLRDDGYDVADYTNVNPLYGNREDFGRFVQEAHRRDLRVITELVVNHTSDQHPWFQAARRAPKDSAERDFYVWSDTPEKYRGTRIIFTDTEKSNWAWDDVAKAFYWHRFFSHQPDLNFDNPKVLEAIYDVMRFWLDLGVDGFRLDAIPYLCEREGTNNENLPETHAVLKKLRAIVDANYPNVLLLAEANQWPEDVREYFGNGDECHMAYHFPLMPRMYMAIALEERHPITEIMGQTPDIPENCQWAIFLRNHDELTLEMVTSKERDYMYNMYAADKRARINLGIRRRLAPLLENDVGRIKLMTSLLLSMPGSPILYYGDELGMGDNIYLGDRDGVRTPMQWRPERNAGFSRADPQRLYLQPIMDSIYGYEIVNVEAQTRAPWSLLNWTRRLLAVRKGFQAFGRGSLAFLRPANRKILAYLRELGDEIVLCVANLSRSAQPVELDLARYKGRVPIELLGRTAFPPVGELPYLLTLSGHGFLWFRLALPETAPAGRDELVPRDELPVLVLFDGWASLFRDRVVPWRISMSEKVRAQLEGEVLPAYIAGRRWYAAKSEAIRHVEIADQVEWKAGERGWLVTLTRVESASGEAQTYSLPLTLAWEDTEESLVSALASSTIAKARQQAQVGVLADAFADETFVRELVAAVGRGDQVKTARGTLQFKPTSAFEPLVGPDPASLAAAMAGAQSSNTIVSLGERVFVKGYRRLQAGINPEVAIGRFLTDVVRFEHCAPVAGSVEYTADDGRSATLALIQKYVSNQGSAWDYTLHYLDRLFEDSSREAAPASADAHAGYGALIRTLGRRTAELHAALARTTGDPAFDPAPIAAADVATWTERLRAQTIDALDRLARRRDSLPESAHADADRLLAQRERLLACIAAHANDAGENAKTRVHGDYHLGQVLLVQNDFVITDFEGEPARTMEERAEKQSPLKDVAGMLRSFDYAMHAALFKFVAERPDTRRAVEAAAAQWRSQAERAFLDGYEEVASANGLACPRSGAGGLLEFFVLEKAVYELRYEVDNRPDWARIPLNGLLDALESGR
ncbi:MAG TPA: maltose alpha-D-glucosyltransferase [Casimicrobiaceae bacterium]|nr:maltose alpha-D-glucosyltransferase [Casimicrobiaceae bacterium]